MDVSMVALAIRDTLGGVRLMAGDRPEGHHNEMLVLAHAHDVVRQSGFSAANFTVTGS